MDVKVIDNAISKMAEKVVANPNHEQALKYSQAALNMAHVKGMLLANEAEKKRTGGS